MSHVQLVKVLCTFDVYAHMPYICWLLDSAAPKSNPEFHFSVFCCRHSDNHPENNLAKISIKRSFYVFGYLLEDMS